MSILVEAREATKPQPRLTDFSPEDQNLYWLFYLSYRFSQGEPESLQPNIFKWLKSMNFFNRLPARLPKVFKLIDLPGQHKFQVRSIISTDLKESYNELLFSPAPVEEKERRALLLEVLDGMLLRDIHYQNLARPRKRLTRNKNLPDSNYDPHASFIRRHALRGASTGHSAFDALFAQLRGIITAQLGRPEAEVTLKLFDLKNSWEYNHPGYSFFPEGFFDGRATKNSRD